jgi:hypothetical protein
MRALVAWFVGFLVLAGFSLAVAGLWSKKLAGSMDAAKIDNANYFLYTWIVAFIVSSVAAVVVLIKMIMYLRRQQYEHDHD